MIDSRYVRYTERAREIFQIEGDPIGLVDWVNSHALFTRVFWPRTREIVDIEDKFLEPCLGGPENE